MTDLKDLFQGADWKTEKHVPVIDAPEKLNRGQILKVTVTVGKEIAHPNTTEHHIRWVAVYFQAEGEKFPYQVSRVDFDAHGESAQGPNTSTLYTVPEVVVNLKTDKSGTIFTATYCNIHGLWKSEKPVLLV